MQEFESKHGWLDVKFDPIVLAELNFLLRFDWKCMLV